MQSITKEKSFCLARKDPFQALSVEVMFPSTPAGALAVGPASLNQTPEKALASEKNPFSLPSQGQCLSPDAPAGRGWSRHTWEEPLHTHKSAPSPPLMWTLLSPRITAWEVAVAPRVRGQPALIFEWMCVLQPNLACIMLNQNVF